MSNFSSNIIFNATCCDGGSYQPRINAPPCCYAGGGERSGGQANGVVGVTVCSLIAISLCLLAVISTILREKKEALQQAVRGVAEQEIKEAKKSKQKESISMGLIVKEWVPDNATVESTSTEEKQDTPHSPSGEAVLEAPAPAPAPLINSSPASCVIGSDDCEFFAGEEDMAGCAICLSPFKTQQLVCESNNSSCQHVFHKDCMVDWLMKRHDNCPMCREVYLLETV
jgi:hypothetical protein